MPIGYDLGMGPEEPRWIGVDLDGTLAHFDMDRWEREGYSYIGRPLIPMVMLVNRLLAEGKKIKIFTARVCTHPDLAIPYIRRWLLEAGLPGDLEITNMKDWYMDLLYDDRCIQVIHNTGFPVYPYEVKMT